MDRSIASTLRAALQRLLPRHLAGWFGRVLGPGLSPRQRALHALRACGVAA